MHDGFSGLFSAGAYAGTVTDSQANAKNMDSPQSLQLKVRHGSRYFTSVQDPALSCLLQSGLNTLIDRCLLTHGCLITPISDSQAYKARSGWLAGKRFFYIILQRKNSCASFITQPQLDIVMAQPESQNQLVPELSTTADNSIKLLQQMFHRLTMDHRKSATIQFQVINDMQAMLDLVDGILSITDER